MSASESDALPSLDQAARHVAEALYMRMGRPNIQIVLWNGDVVGCADPIGRIHIRNRQTLLSLPLNPNLHFGDGYSRGDIEIDGDLIDTLTEIYRRLPKGADRTPWRRLTRQLVNPRRNSPDRARRNIHAHYDLGNDFYRLWLDREMVYTCAYFEDRDSTLEEAQLAKMHHVCRKLRLRPGEQVVEAGCGWGSLALHMARFYGVKVRAFNISHEQIEFARDRARREELDGQVEFIEDDYRNIQGKYDAFVSVGMLEHVGREHHRDLGDTIHRVLADHGRGLLHSVGRNRRESMRDWIEKRIFPGSYVPSLGEMTAILEPYDFSVIDVENLRLHYAMTLREWLRRFDAAGDQVRTMFDDEFVRAWRLYLGGCSAAFASGVVQLFQLLFTRPGVNELPLTRADLYLP
ncbi:MAG: class I SAM-dependent methyltransferase [Alphaproteobacteria bacterium]|nr:MAG: class I SAM-dependent methyltransferase [Alphaproteobacteria bacterium]